ncbi:hypothetical protein A2U01_0059544, partial [Trifolium medium]|nr:hypothetical protein [Trifolium medium]
MRVLLLAVAVELALLRACHLSAVPE